MKVTIVLVVLIICITILLGIYITNIAYDQDWCNISKQLKQMNTVLEYELDKANRLLDTLPRESEIVDVKEIPNEKYIIELNYKDVHHKTVDAKAQAIARAVLEVLNNG